jgi:hypothetical protein
VNVDEAIQQQKKEEEMKRPDGVRPDQECRAASSLHISMHTASKYYSYSYTTQQLAVVHRQDVVVRQCDRLQWPCQLACAAGSSDVVLRCCAQPECTLLCYDIL